MFELYNDAWITADLTLSLCLSVSLIARRQTLGTPIHRIKSSQRKYSNPNSLSLSYYSFIGPQRILHHTGSSMSWFIQTERDVYLPPYFILAYRSNKLTCT